MARRITLAIAAKINNKFRGSVIALGLALTLLGCVSVAPYERENLTRPSMDVSREGSEAGFHAHVHDSREGATGGHGSTGGGCGCN